MVLMISILRLSLIQKELSGTIGVNTVCTTVQNMCQEAGVEGYKTNHSLRVTAATCLFHEGKDEQLIMARTGHHSTDGVQTYKRTSMEQHKELSDALQGGQGEAKRPKVVEEDKENDACIFTGPPQPIVNFNNCQSITINYK